MLEIGFFFIIRAFINPERVRQLIPHNLPLPAGPRQTSVVLLEGLCRSIPLPGLAAGLQGHAIDYNSIDVWNAWHPLKHWIAFEAPVLLSSLT
jgi:hypothetical protein